MRILLLLLLFVSTLSANTPQSKIEKKAINYYINGNYTKYFNQITYLIKKYPESPDSLFYLLTLNIDQNSIPNLDNIHSYHKKLVEKKNIDFFTKQIILNEVVDYYRNLNEFKNAQKSLKKCG